MNDSPGGPERRGRRRRRHGRAERDGRDGPGRSALLAPLSKPKRLDFDLPVSEPFTPEETREMTEHLSFIRRHKAVLGLSLNATEDLLVQGVRPPTDRGVCRHLLSKVDRKLVERALSREAARTDPLMRARLLAGVVRINADASLLLFYLDALSSLKDRREAAAAFALTVDRIDFGSLSNAQMATLLDVITRTFEGDDRVQVLFGLLASESFERTLARSLEAVPEALRAIHAPLRAAYRSVMLGEQPKDERERALAGEGVAVWLSAPDAILRSYAPEVRARLAAFAAEHADLETGAKAALSLVDSLNHAEPDYVELACALADRFLAAGLEDRARALYNQVLQAQPNSTHAVRRRDALGWQRVGRLAVGPGGGEQGSRLLRGFLLDDAIPVWARIGKPRDAERLQGEAKLHARLALPGIAQYLGGGTSSDGTPFVTIAPGGLTLDVRRLDRWTLSDALSLAAEAARILAALAAAGVLLPDAAPVRFLIDRGAPHSIRLADLDGAVEADVEKCRRAHGAHARELARRILGGQAGDGRAAQPTALGRLDDSAGADAIARALAEEAARVFE